MLARSRRVHILRSPIKCSRLTCVQVRLTASAQSMHCAPSAEESSAQTAFMLRTAALVSQQPRTGGLRFMLRFVAFGRFALRCIVVDYGEFATLSSVPADSIPKQSNPMSGLVTHRPRGLIC